MALSFARRFGCAVLFALAGCSVLINPDQTPLSDDTGSNVDGSNPDAILDVPTTDDVQQPESGRCGAGQLLCGGVCVDASVDPNNCGHCGGVCGTGQTCVAGACACATGLMSCGSSCANLAVDPAHCGTCTNVCPSGVACSGGHCQIPSCPSPTTYDPTTGMCVNTQDDARNCGMPGHRCTAPDLCLMGTCVCAPGFTPSGGRCLDLTSDPQNCGTPGNRCAPVAGGDRACIGGNCRSAFFCSGGSLTNCPTANPGLVLCTDVSIDPYNCGSCGTVCGVSQVCINSGCEDLRPGTGCTTCPCTRCASGDACCPNPTGSTTTPAVCIAGGSCP